VLFSAAAGALLFTGIAHAGGDELISICVNPKHQKINLPLGSACNPPNRLLTWDLGGVTGPTGPEGPLGEEGAIGPTGPQGVPGPQGPVGPAGAVGPVGDVGATGPDGSPGETGQQGPQGPTGPTGMTGPTGSTGPSGVNGVNGEQFYALGGGDLGANVQGLLLSDETTLAGANSPIFYGPGNGADKNKEAIAVPIDASTETQLYVQTKNVPGPGQSYEFFLCINKNCDTGVECEIDLPNLTSCNDLVDTLTFKPGDTISLEGVASGGAAPTEVTWSVVMHQTGGDLP